TSAPATAPPGPAGVAVAKLVSCRRAPGGVRVAAQVAQTGGRPSRFVITVSVLGPGDAPLGRATGETNQLGPGASAPLEVLVPVSGPLSGASCQLDGTAGA
ncbi:MAG: hypothetical protein JWN46_581, partial [Acidimicrobiales bacterium]|nr:hypothetical protein [Acidimicrobiales bacterium]